MRKKIGFILLVLFSFSAASTLSSCNRTEAKATYECPMHCEGSKTYDKPGKCPVCQMELVKTDKETHEEIKDTAEMAKPQ